MYHHAITLKPKDREQLNWVQFRVGEIFALANLLHSI